MVEIKLTKHQDKREELLDLFQASFRHNISAELWDWKHLKNPLATADPEVIVAVKKNRIVGARPFLLAEMWLGNEKIKVAHPCDTMVHPEHQREGIFSRMNLFAIEYFKQNGYSFFYNCPGPLAFHGYLKQGWRIVSPTEPLYKFANPQKLVLYKLKNKLLSKGLGILYDKLLNPSIKTSQLSNAFQMKMFDQFTSHLQDVDTLRTKSAVDLVRSKSYLRWRFDQHPQREYKYILAIKNSELWGYAAVSVEKWHNLVRGMIVDYLVKEEDINCFRVLIGKCLDVLEKSDYDLASIWTFCYPRFTDELVKYFGFKSLSRFPYNKFSVKRYFTVCVLDEQVLEKIDIYNKMNWRVTSAYEETT